MVTPWDCARPGWSWQGERQSQTPRGLGQVPALAGPGFPTKLILACRAGALLGGGGGGGWGGGWRDEGGEGGLLRGPGRDEHGMRAFLVPPPPPPTVSATAAASSTILYKVDLPARFYLQELLLKPATDKPDDPSTPDVLSALIFSQCSLPKVTGLGDLETTLKF